MTCLFMIVHGMVFMWFHVMDVHAGSCPETLFGWSFRKSIFVWRKFSRFRSWHGTPSDPYFFVAMEESGLLQNEDVPSLLFCSFGSPSAMPKSLKQLVTTPDLPQQYAASFAKQDYLKTVGTSLSF